MSCTDINAILAGVLAGVLTMLAIFAAIIWVSPEACRMLSLHLFCRAQQIEAGRKAYADTLKANAE